MTTRLAEGSLVAVIVSGIAHGLGALREGGVAPKLLIIDDGWQSTQLDEPLRPISESGAVKSENKVSPSSLPSPYKPPAAVHYDRVR